MRGGKNRGGKNLWCLKWCVVKIVAGKKSVCVNWGVVKIGVVKRGCC